MPASNTPNYSFDNEYQILKFNSHENKSGNYTSGKSCVKLGKWSINNEGWNSPIDYVTKKSKKRIAVIGDSYIEAFQVNNDESYPYLLNQKLSIKGFEVYSFGISGAPLSQYLHMCRYIKSKYDPDYFIINLVHNDFDESLTKYSFSPFYKTLYFQTDSVIEKEPQFYETSYSTKWLKKSALIRYLVNNVKLKSNWSIMQSNASDLNSFNANVNVNKLKERKNEIEKMLKYVSTCLIKEFGEKKILFVMDGCRNDIYTNKLEQSNVLFINRMFVQIASQHHLSLIDLNYTFQSDFTKNKIKFESIYDYHWNSYGHQIVADTVFNYLIQKN